MTKYLNIIILCLFWVACSERPKIKSEKGTIEIITNIYFKASTGLDSIKSYQVSKLNYQGDEIIEFVPNLDYPQFTDNIYFIRDTLFLDMGTEEEAKRIIVDDTNNRWSSVYKKKNGTVFFKGIVPKYGERKEIADTVLFDKKYERFEVHTPNNFTRYYVYRTDTILPYSLNSKIDDDYRGRLERIDSYDKVRDIFITVQLLHHKEINDVAQDIFDFNQFVNKKNN